MAKRRHFCDEFREIEAVGDAFCEGSYRCCLSSFKMISKVVDQFGSCKVVRCTVLMFSFHTYLMLKRTAGGRSITTRRGRESRLVDDRALFSGAWFREDHVVSVRDRTQIIFRGPQ